MEDATDFSWQGAKAAHAVLLCEMERGSLQWEDLDRIDRVHRAHAQKHISNKSTWGKVSDHSGRKPWYCKNYQTGFCAYSRDHDFNGKLPKHICSFCLIGGRQLAHPEKECTYKKSLGCSSCSGRVTGNNPKYDTSVIPPTKVLGVGLVTQLLTIGKCIKPDFSIVQALSLQKLKRC